MSLAIATEKRFEEMKDYELEKYFTEKVKNFVEEKIMKAGITIIDLSRMNDVTRWKDEFEKSLGAHLKGFEISASYHRVWNTPPFMGFSIEFDAGKRTVECVIGIEATDLNIGLRLVDAEPEARTIISTSTLDYKPRYNVYCFVKPQKRKR
jgi:hypothetical protein